MSTTSSCQSHHHHQVVGKCERSGTREFTAEKTLGRKTLCFFGEVAVRGRRWRVSVSAVARLDPESGRQNVHETVARARFHIKSSKTDGLGPLFQDDVDKSLISIHSFQFVRFNSFMSIHSFQLAMNSHKPLLGIY